MELRVFDPEMDLVAIIDSFISLIWTDRYCGFGDFELHTAVSYEALTYLKLDNYVLTDASDTMMIIETWNITTDPDNGNVLIVTGRSLESVLDRRIVMSRIYETGSLQNGIYNILNDTTISPIDPSRKIVELDFALSSDQLVTDLTMGSYFYGENVYEIIEAYCSANNIGFKVEYVDTGDKVKSMLFKLYAGVDRSYSQSSNSFVVFSPNFENIKNTAYLESKKALKTVTDVVGVQNDAGGYFEQIVESDDTITGLNRRELYSDAGDILKTDPDGLPISDADYNVLLQQRGILNLNDNRYIITFDGQIEMGILYEYRKDFFIGDIVQLANEYGIETPVRITEMIQSDGPTGHTIYPTFKSI